MTTHSLNTTVDLIFAHPPEARLIKALMLKLKPCSENEDEQCIKVLNDTSLNIVTPNSKISGGLRQEVALFSTLQITCSFSKVLLSDSSQKEVFDCVANNMVTSLINGKNGLLFTYGITGSGKTYTLGGTSSEPGILPRCVNTIYNSIKENLAPPGVFFSLFTLTIRLDKNGQVELTVETRAALSTPKSYKKNVTICETPACLRRGNAENDVDKNFVFALFISMVEIYNNNIYDLFDDNFEHSTVTRPPTSKILRENNIHGLVYVPVRSVSEALTYYRKGKKRRKIAETVLNSQSSRSHCVFTIYLVQMERSVDKGNRHGTLSQLSLCDLAGSERMYRTQNEGDRQKESSSINSSLMTLRSCIEVLRENQRSFTKCATARLVPYRESRLTLMFRNFFEGEGKIRMILCLNPIPGDFEENIVLHVIRFAEVTQEVKIKVEPKSKTREFKQHLDSTVPHAMEIYTPCFKPGPSIFPPFPTAILSSYDDARTIPELIQYLHECDRLRVNLRKELFILCEGVLKEVAKMEQDNQGLKEKYQSNSGKIEDLERQNSQLRHSYKIAKKKVLVMEEQNKKLDVDTSGLKSELEAFKQKYSNERSARHILKRKLNELQTHHVDKLERECNKRVQEATEDMKNKLIQHDHRIKVVQGVLHNTSCLPPISEASGSSSLLPTPKFIN
ncbi:hypothetical protein MXB_3629, partial [Myxobolus squamalis]